MTARVPSQAARDAARQIIDDLLIQDATPSDHDLVTDVIAAFEGAARKDERERCARAADTYAAEVRKKLGRGATLDQVTRGVAETLNACATAIQQDHP